MIKMKSKINKDGENNTIAIHNYSNKDNNHFLDNELSIITKKIKKELNIYKKLFKNIRLDFLQIHSEFEIETNKYKTNIKKIDILENEIELIQKNKAKLNKKKIYIISSIIKFKKLYTQDKIEKYKSILNIGLNGPQNSDNILENIIKMDNEEFICYLDFLEKYYTNLEKENNLQYFRFKNDVNSEVNDENLDFPIDKILLFLSYIIQIIDNTNQLNSKFKEIKEIELIKNEQSIKIKKLEESKIEKINVMVKINDYIELFKNLIEKYDEYQQQYKNNLISKDTLYKKIRKLQSINIENNSIFDRNNNLMDKSVLSEISDKNNNSRFTSNVRNKKKIPLILVNKSQTISRNVPTDYLYKSEELLSKKYNLGKNIILFNDMISSISIENREIKENENISEDSENESPISTINITRRKKSLKNTPIVLNSNNNNQINIKVKSISIDKFNKKDINNSEHNKKKIEGIDTQKLYCKKKPFISINTKNKILKINTKIKNEKINPQNILGKKFITLAQNDNSKYNKDRHFKKIIDRNRNFSVNKKKLFNKESKTVIINESKLNIKKDSKLNSESESKQNALTKSNDSFENLGINNNKYKYSIENNLFNQFEYHNEDICSNKCKDSLNTIKNVLKKRNYLYLNKNKITKIKNNRNFSFKAEVPNENCCISCI